ncbi:gasdermin-A3-like [Motacilla alba alba]|uniref:gasdermin-A3-like n=1 Tax=Motacilla alba alba TaxID=1094192 RepID=UPI0018D51FB5|nr:gasdermin-A3-like [Motacilla alba alba]XP_038018963.1 gasdermin-A3-like [Motacilla alba alba]XP_038018964.1 gasdermin-A3-like [Motacilla alba alba]
MFKTLTKFIVNQMDPSKELDPVESIADNEHFRPLCLLRKKRKSDRIFHRAPYYQQTGFTLNDVLLPGEDGKSIDSLHQDSSQFTLTKTSTDQVGGHASVPLGSAIASANLEGSASSSKGFSITLQKKSIRLQSLEEQRTEKQINMNHSLIQQLQTTNTKLYMVTEILEASEDTIYKASIMADGSFNIKCHATLGAQGTTESNQGIVIPKGCTLAFRTTPLHIRDGKWNLKHFANKEQSRRCRFIPLSGRIEIRPGLEEVETRCRIFSELSPDLLLIIFNTIKAVMRDKSLLQELSQKMEEVSEQNDGYDLETESPDLKDLFSALQHCPRDRLLPLAEGITYVLDALHELTEHQLLLLLESLERKIVSQQLNLVANILEYDKVKRKGTFLVDARLLLPHEEEQRLTIALVELSGVQLQEDGSIIPIDKPFEAMVALLVALYALNLLSGLQIHVALPRHPYLEMLEVLGQQKKI